MLPVRLKLDIRCVDYLVYLYRDTYLPAVWDGMELAGLWSDAHQCTWEIKSVSCNVPGRFLEAWTEGHVFKADEQKDRPESLRQDKRKDEVLPDYLAEGWRIAWTESFGKAPKIDDGPKCEWEPWSGGPEPASLT